jgi:hypothetical protein
MRCPKCDRAALEEVCWVPDESGAFMVVECRSCDLLYRRARRAASGRFRTPTDAESVSSSDKPTWRPPRLRSA